MKGFARLTGFLYMVGGSILMLSPMAGKEMIQLRAGLFRSLADWTAEYAELSPGALRLLGGSIFIIGAVLLWVTSEPAIEAKTGTSLPSRLGKAA